MKLRKEELNQKSLKIDQKEMIRSSDEIHDDVFPIRKVRKGWIE